MRCGASIRATSAPPRGDKLAHGCSAGLWQPYTATDGKAAEKALRPVAQLGYLNKLGGSLVLLYQLGRDSFRHAHEFTQHGFLGRLVA